MAPCLATLTDLWTRRAGLYSISWASCTNSVRPLLWRYDSQTSSTVWLRYSCPTPHAIGW